jgi:tetratricopeptide (TPR) repeat protein
MTTKDELRILYILLSTVILAVATSCGSPRPAQNNSPSTGAPASVPANSTASPAASVAEQIAQADKLYNQREDLARVREAIVLLRQAHAVDYSSYDAAWRLAKFNYYLGAHTKDEAERDRAFKEGVEAGQSAIKLQEAKPEGHFWLGANLGGQAQQSALSGLASLDDIRKEMERVIQIDEGYQSGSAYMVLGQVDLEAPRMMGGDPENAVKTLEKGLTFGENNSPLRLRLAQAYKAVNRKEDARKQLNAIINMKTPNPDYMPEHKEAVEEARKMLEKGL